MFHAILCAKCVPWGAVVLLGEVLLPKQCRIGELPVCLGFGTFGPLCVCNDTSG